VITFLFVTLFLLLLLNLYLIIKWLVFYGATGREGNGLLWLIFSWWFLWCLSLIFFVFMVLCSEWDSVFLFLICDCLCIAVNGNDPANHLTKKKEFVFDS